MQHKHPRWAAFRKVIQKVHEGPCYPKDIYSDTNLRVPQRSVQYGLNLGLYLHIFRKLKDGRYVWIDHVEKEEKMKDVLEDFRLLYCRWPRPKEVASDFGANPVEVENIIYKVAGSQPAERRWREPTEEDILTASFLAHRRLQLAALIKHGCKQSQYVKKNWPPEELNKAEDVLKRYPNFVPRIDLSPDAYDPDKVRCQLSWHEKTKAILGRHYPQNHLGPWGAFEYVSIERSELEPCRSHPLM